MKKRFKSMLIVMSLLVSLCMGTCMTVFAAESNTIEELSVTAAPEKIEVGKLPSDYASEIVVPESEQYEIAIEWGIYGEDGMLTAITENQAFEKGKEYGLSIIYQAKEGYVFPESEFDIWVEADDSYWYELKNEDEYAENPVFVIEYLYSLKEVILEVELNNVQEAAVGEVASLESIMVPEGANYSIHNEMSGWYDYMNNMESCLGQAFVEGHRYTINISIEPNEGYCFSDETVLKINGEVQTDNFYAGKEYVDWSKDYSFTTSLENVVIDLTLDTPSAGKKVKDMTVSVPDDQVYSILKTVWYNEAEYEELNANSVFALGGMYSTEITVIPAEGFVFDDTAVMTLNGEAYENFSVYEDGSIVVYVYHSIYGDIDTVEVFNVTAPVIGEKAVLKTISLPENAKYKIDWENTCWIDSTTFENLEEGAVFEEGKEYMLMLSVVPKKGNAFAETVKVWIDGEETGDFFAGPSSVEIMKVYSFLEEIEKLEILDKIPTAAAGEQAQEEIALKVPADAPYEVTGSWAVYTSDGEFLPFTGTFEKGKAYIFGISAMAKEGYAFADGLEVYAKEEKKETIHVVHLGSMYVSMYIQDLGDNTIYSVELNVKEPVVGAEIKVEDLEVPKDAPYEIQEIMWVDPITYEELTGVFEENKQYELSFSIAVKGSYLFADDLKFIINGTELSFDKLTGLKLFTPILGVAGITYDLTVEVEVPEQKPEEMDEIPKEEPEEETEQEPAEKEEDAERAPQTGDSSLISIWILLLAVSVVYIIRNRKMA